MALPKKAGRCRLCRHRNQDKPTAGRSGLYDLDVCQDCLDEEAQLTRTTEAFHALAGAFRAQR